MLLGLALATNLIGIGDPFDFVIFSVLHSIAYILWTLLLLKITRAVLRHAAQNEKHLSILHPQTLPLFLNLANKLPDL